jgi:hypothetical protein
MFPLFAVMGEPPLINIALWGVVWLALGIALHARASATGAAQRTVAALAQS